MSPKLKKKLKKLLGEEWTWSGHEPWCSCDGCWTDRRTSHHHPSRPAAHLEAHQQGLFDDNPDWCSAKVYRRWWERPLWLTLLVLVSALATYVFEHLLRP
jgi:hypothetical protein